MRAVYGKQVLVCKLAMSFCRHSPVWPFGWRLAGFSGIGDGGKWANEPTCQYRLGDLPGGVDLGGIYDVDFVRRDGKFISSPSQRKT